MVEQDIQKNIESIRIKIEESARLSGRSGKDVTLIAVTKTRSVEEMVFAIQHGGISAIGENRVQEALEKKKQWPEDVEVEWHLIGHLQRNKARKALESFHMIQSVDSISLADTLQRICSEENRSIPILLEVNTSGEESKHGVAPEQAETLLEHVQETCPLLSLKGFMTVGPLTEDEMSIRKAFASLRELRDRLEVSSGLPLQELSMGMSGDFGWAIEEGSTMVRVGSAIFGARSD